ncbi:hypothetical protein mvi_49520 [Methylobacterium indicum]|uniref:Uncharacterized protein n=1 Tax=Methylobacterium indicum TaxID=1775910 RepID=A0A8H9C984_9HYPH|nr:hypothetical protein mvi_49520 [Methylobacterium indicum]
MPTLEAAFPAAATVIDCDTVSAAVAVMVEAVACNSVAEDDTMLTMPPIALLEPMREFHHRAATFTGRSFVGDALDLGPLGGLLGHHRLDPVNRLADLADLVTTSRLLRRVPLLNEDSK